VAGEPSTRNVASGAPTYAGGVLPGRLAPVAGGVGLAAAATSLALIDPARPSSPFPACMFHSVTGLWCPGCGLTRGTHRLLRGDVVGAMELNVLTPLVVVAVALAWWHWFRRSTRRAGVPVPAWLPTFAALALPILLVAFGIARNLPGLEVLAPAGP